MKLKEIPSYDHLLGSICRFVFDAVIDETCSSEKAVSVVGTVLERIYLSEYWNLFF